MHTKVSLSTSWQLYPSPLSMGQGTMPTWWWHVMQWCAHRHLHGIGTEKPAPQWCRHVSTDCGAVSCKWPLSTCFLSASSSGDVSLPSSPEKSGARLDSNLAWTSLEHYSYSVALNYGCTKRNTGKHSLFNTIPGICPVWPGWSLPAVIAFDPHLRIRLNRSQALGHLSTCTKQHLPSPWYDMTLWMTPCISLPILHCSHKLPTPVPSPGNFTMTWSATPWTWHQQKCKLATTFALQYNYIIV